MGVVGGGLEGLSVEYRFLRKTNGSGAATDAVHDGARPRPRPMVTVMDKAEEPRSRLMFLDFWPVKMYYLFCSAAQKIER